MPKELLTLASRELPVWTPTAQAAGDYTQRAIKANMMQYARSKPEKVFGYFLGVVESLHARIAELEARLDVSGSDSAMVAVADTVVPDKSTRPAQMQAFSDKHGWDKPKVDKTAKSWTRMTLVERNERRASEGKPPLQLGKIKVDQALEFNQMGAQKVGQ